MATVRPLPAAVGGFAAFRLWLMLRPVIDQKLKEDLARGMAPERVAAVRRTYADIQEAARQYSAVERAAARGAAAVVSAAVDAPSSHGTWTTKRAASRLGIRERWVRQLLEDGRLDGDLVAGRWQVVPESVELYDQTRRSA